MPDSLTVAMSGNRHGDHFSMDLTTYRHSEREQARTQDLLSLMPTSGHHALDVGARDGHLSKLMADRFELVVALDLDRPSIDHPRVAMVQGDACHLPFASDSFDLVTCCEVLEHIPPPLLASACAELARVARQSVVIGVPYKQDIRFGRTTCQHCGRANPPWGHVNSFDEQRLHALFAPLTPARLSFVGQTTDATSALAAALMDFAGNPYGTYSQDEPCVCCGRNIGGPLPRTLAQKMATKAAFTLNRLQRVVSSPRGNWIHLRLEKAPSNRV